MAMSTVELRDWLRAVVKLPKWSDELRAGALRIQVGISNLHIAIGELSARLAEAKRTKRDLVTFVAVGSQLDPSGTHYTPATLSRSVWVGEHTESFSFQPQLRSRLSAWCILGPPEIELASLTISNIPIDVGRFGICNVGCNPENRISGRFVRRSET
jgi:hypothetical protein